jgi:hypothetical protein
MLLKITMAALLCMILSAMSAIQEVGIENCYRSNMWILSVVK